MIQEDRSIFYKAYNPFLQAAVVFGAAVIVMVGGKFVHWTGLIEVGERFPWLSAAAFMLFYAIFNSIFSLSAADLNKYWSRSIMSFAALAAANGLMAYLFSSLSIDEAGSYRWIYVVLTLGYLVFLSVMGFMKRIVEFAQKEEWNHPRLRNRRGKGRR
ncbi:MAG: hypothetical protein KDC43_06375 [Saprospiraceae bacterium]|nr:hypothetical protein [Saprospiraceae bacterium]MCB0623538.1 hypothetical protein [Saprospiraceae bacterium]MCB0677212.1 hypothetical protein [Saprospiraceae bacterium]MCB0680033.1 hypothetical protein [Saprospiraceae bacterium]